jgi:hypothetical protein
MIIRWLLNDIKNSDSLSIGLLMIFTSFVGGYMISDFPRKFLDLFNHPFGQFIAFIAINIIARYQNKSFNMTYIIIESIISVILLQLFKFIVFSIYKNK